jgi:hypothetical protein
VTYSDFLVSGMMDSAENFRPKIAVFSANSYDAKPERWVRFNKNRDFDDIGNGESE